MENYNILILILSILFSAFFSGLEIAFYRVNQLHVELEKQKGIAPARLISYFTNHPSSFITNTLIGNNVALVIYGLVFTIVFEQIFHVPEGILSFLIITFSSTLLILIFAEFLPKALFIINPLQMLKVFAIPYWFIYILLYPLNIVTSILSKLLLRISGTHVKDEKHAFNHYDLFQFVTDEQIEKSVDQKLDLDKNMIRKVIDLPNIKIRECLVPRTELVAIEESDSLENLRNLFIKSGHSKILVYQDNIDQVVGFVHIIDLYNHPKSIKDITRPIIIVAESMPANKLLKQFTESNRSLGLVVDEYGGTAGLVTIEDLLEEIFGEIEDEYDIESLREVRINDKEFIFSARHEIDYLNEKYGLNIPEGDYETLGGFVLEIHESIPVENTRINYQNLEIKVLSAKENLIEEVQVKIL